jgi:hypothetical protein
VTATKGTGAYNSIGKGYLSVTCGTITIGGKEYWCWYEGAGWIYNGTAADELLHKNSLVYLKANADDSGNYWTTYYSDANHYQAPAGTKVFKVKLEGKTVTLGEITSGIVNSDQGVVLKSTSANYFLTSTTSSTEVAESYEGNDLIGTMSLISNPGNAYVLNKGTAGIGFYKLSENGTIGAHKAYLVYEAPAQSAPAFFALNEVTSLREMSNERLVNGNNDYYTLDGRKLNAKPTTKGLYIVNGKVVVIK